MQTLPLNKRTKTTLCKMAGTALEFLPMTGAPSDCGPGRKIFFPIPLKKNPGCSEDFLYVFAESKLPYEPAEPEIGFTEDDIINTTGIYLFSKARPHAVGAVWSVDVLFAEVFTDLALQNRVIYKLNEMKKIVKLDDEFLEAANIDRSQYSAQDLKKFNRIH